MKAYIHKYCTISVLDSLARGILPYVNTDHSHELVEPVYKDLIPASHLRRMSKVIRMGVSTALKVMEENEAAGVIVGSGIGCYGNSLDFTREYLDNETGSLAPTAFIQSTDNTIAGQIAIILKNNGYNITYIHKGLAFENALVDAMLLSEEIQDNVLVGGVDEWIQLFEAPLNLSQSSELWESSKTDPHYWIGEGASFFLLNQQEENALAKIAACQAVSCNREMLTEKINSFLSQHELSNPGLILYGDSFINREPITGNILNIETFNYSALCGIYFTNSAFGVQLAAEILSSPDLARSKGLYAANILVVNNFYDTDFGLIYLTAH